MYYKAQHLRTVFCCSCRARCCHFLQFNCNVAPKLRFHAYVISVFKDELIFLKDFKKGKVLVSQRRTDQRSPFDRLVHLSIFTDWQACTSFSVTERCLSTEPL